LINCINKALFELGQEQFDSVSIKVLKEIMQVLESIKLVVKELSKTNSNLLIPEGVFVFSVNKLQQPGTDLANEMMHALKSRINKKRKILYLYCIFCKVGTSHIHRTIIILHILQKA